MLLAAISGFFAMPLCAADTAQTAGSPASSLTYFPVFPSGAGDQAAPQLIPIAANHALDGDHKGLTHAVIVIHDYTRNADATLAMMTGLAGPHETTSMIIAPQFLLDMDLAAQHFASDEIKVLTHWSLGAWESGGDSLTQAPQKGVSSFTVIDLLLMYLGDKKFFPDLQSITVAGHGAGGDFVQRYAAMGQAPDILSRQNLPVRFVAANASSYLYFTNTRLTASKQGGKPAFGTPDAAQCPGYNNYPYGLEGGNSYLHHVGGDTVKLRYVTRPVLILTGDQINGDPLIDTSCAALLQGNDRMARAMNYSTYLSVSFGDAAKKLQKFVTLPKIGYDPAPLLGSQCSLSFLFGNGDCL